MPQLHCCVCQRTWPLEWTHNQIFIYNYNNKIKQANLHSEIDSKENWQFQFAHYGYTSRPNRTYNMYQNQQSYECPFQFLTIRTYTNSFANDSTKISSHHTRGFTPAECLSVSNCLTNVTADEYIGLSTAELVINVWSRGRSSCRSMSSAVNLQSVCHDYIAVYDWSTWWQARSSALCG